MMRVVFGQLQTGVGRVAINVDGLTVLPFRGDFVRVKGAMYEVGGEVRDITHSINAITGDHDVLVELKPRY